MAQYTQSKAYARLLLDGKIAWSGVFATQQKFAQRNITCETFSAQADNSQLWSVMADNNKSSGSEDQSIVIKKYANRRLYNTATSSYVTLDDLCQMVRDEQDFTVHDARSGADITHQVLTQIIVEQEASGTNLLPISFLRQLICLYDDSLHAFVPHYLEVAMDTFTRNRDEMRGQLDRALGGKFSFSGMEDMGRQNMDMIRNAMRMFTSFAGQNMGAGQNTGAGQSAGAGQNTGESARGDDASPSGDLTDLKDKLDEMQSQLDALAKKSGGKD